MSVQVAQGLVSFWSRATLRIDDLTIFPPTTTILSRVRLGARRANHSNLNQVLSRSLNFKICFLLNRFTLCRKLCLVTMLPATRLHTNQQPQRGSDSKTTLHGNHSDLEKKKFKEISESATLAVLTARESLTRRESKSVATTARDP